MARRGASAHLLRYRPNDEPLDCRANYQAGHALRLFGLRLPAIVYTAFRLIDPAMETGAEFTAKYQVALKIHGGG